MPAAVHQHADRGTTIMVLNMHFSVSCIKELCIPQHHALVNTFMAFDFIALACPCQKVLQRCFGFWCINSMYIHAHDHTMDLLTDVFPCCDTPHAAMFATVHSLH